jgi:hypothetical protein
MSSRQTVDLPAAHSWHEGADAVLGRHICDAIITAVEFLSAQFMPRFRPGITTPYGQPSEPKSRNVLVTHEKKIGRNNHR